jgi:hypothetical protein
LTDGGSATEKVDDGTRPIKLLINVADLRRRLGQRRVENVEITRGWGADG